MARDEVAAVERAVSSALDGVGQMTIEPHSIVLPEHGSLR
jgi:hypothetical protein